MKALHCIIFVATKKTSGTNILPPKIEELFSSVWLEYGPGNASLLTRYICNYTYWAPPPPPPVTLGKKSDPVKTH